MSNEKLLDGIKTVELKNIKMHNRMPIESWNSNKNRLKYMSPVFTFLKKIMDAF